MFYGIDLSKESFKAALLEKDSNELRMISCNLHGEAFERFKAQLTEEDNVAVEASTNTLSTKKIEKLSTSTVKQIKEVVKKMLVD